MASWSERGQSSDSRFSPGALLVVTSISAFVATKPTYSDRNFGFESNTRERSLCHGELCIFTGDVAFYCTSDGSRTVYINIIMSSGSRWCPEFAFWEAS